MNAFLVMLAAFAYSGLAAPSKLFTLPVVGPKGDAPKIPPVSVADLS
jgi:hypothetical protein